MGMEPGMVRESMIASSINTKAKRVRHFILYLISQFREDGCQQSAALLTYQSLFAVVPFFTLMFLVFSKIPMFKGFEYEVEKFIFENIVPENVSGIRAYLSEFLQQASTLSTVSIVILILTSFLMLLTIEKTLNHIWKIDRPRRGGRRILMYSAVLILSPLLIGVGMALSTYFFSLPVVADVAEPLRILTYLPFFLAAIAFALIYYGTPNCFVPFYHALAGGFLTALLFELLKSGFVFVLAKTSLAVIYGTYVAIPLFLIWLYTVWMIILFGAEWVKALGSYDEVPVLGSGQDLYGLLALLEVFYNAVETDEPVTEKGFLAHNPSISQRDWYDYIKYLSSRNLIKARGSGYVLDSNLSDMTLFDLIESSPWIWPVRSADNYVNPRIGSLFEEIRQYYSEHLSTGIEPLFQKGMPEESISTEVHRESDQEG